MTRDNWNCDGSGPHVPGEVRKYALPGSANLILCPACWRRENQWRQECNRTLAPANAYPIHDWAQAARYPEE